LGSIRIIGEILVTQLLFEGKRGLGGIFEKPFEVYRLTITMFVGDNRKIKFLTTETSITQSILCVCKRITSRSGSKRKEMGGVVSRKIEEAQSTGELLLCEVFAEKKHVPPGISSILSMGVMHNRYGARNAANLYFSAKTPTLSQSSLIHTKGVVTSIISSDFRDITQLLCCNPKRGFETSASHSRLQSQLPHRSDQLFS
jgi:hypothetical protein